MPAGIPDAVQAASTASLYLHAADGGWLGWENNLQPFVRAVGALHMAENLRDVITNVAKYHP